MRAINRISIPDRTVPGLTTSAPDAGYCQGGGAQHHCVKNTTGVRKKNREKHRGHRHRDMECKNSDRDWQAERTVTKWKNTNGMVCPKSGGQVQGK